jgi:hypothetical protein
VKPAVQQQPVTANSARFDACIIVYNPRSTQAEQAKQRLERLKKLFPQDAVTLLQFQPGADTNRALLREQAAQLGSRTLLAVGGGDGTVNFVVDALLHDPHFTPEQRRATVLPLWGGNGNDLAYMLNGSPGRLSLDRLLQAGKPVSVYPLCCAITTNEKTTNYTAICYASFGASAFAAQQLESMRGARPFFHRSGLAKFIHELGMVWRAMLRAPRFLVLDTASPRPIYDRLFINGSRFAKVSGIPLHLTDKQFYAITVEQKRASEVAYHLAELLRRHPEHYVVQNGQVIDFTLYEAAWAQIDGEIIHLSTGSSVRMYQAKQPFHALSTLLSS